MYSAPPPPAKGTRLGIACRRWNDGATEPKEKFDDILSHLDTIIIIIIMIIIIIIIVVILYTQYMNVTDRQTDRRTDTGRIARAYVKRRVLGEIAQYEIQPCRF